MVLVPIQISTCGGDIVDLNTLMGCHLGRRLSISNVISEYSVRIEDRNFALLFKKLEPSSTWSEPALKAWSVIDE